MSKSSDMDNATNLQKTVTEREALFVTIGLLKDSKKEIQDLKAKLEKAESVIKYYGDIVNYYESSDLIFDILRVEDTEDIQTTNDGLMCVGGRRARKYFKDNKND